MTYAINFEIRRNLAIATVAKIVLGVSHAERNKSAFTANRKAVQSDSRKAYFTTGHPSCFIVVLCIRSLISMNRSTSVVMMSRQEQEKLN